MTQHQMAGDDKGGAGRGPGRPRLATALIIEPELAQARRIQAVLDGAGLHATVVHDHDTALTSLAVNLPGLIVFNAALREHEELGFLARARRLLGANVVPTVVLGGQGDQPEGFFGDATAEVYLEVPFADDDLEAAVATARWMQPAPSGRPLQNKATERNPVVRNVRKTTRPHVRMEDTSEHAIVARDKSATPRSDSAVMVTRSAPPEAPVTGAPAIPAGEDGRARTESAPSPPRPGPPRPGTGTAPMATGPEPPSDRATGRPPAPAQRRDDPRRKRFKSTLSFSASRVATVSTVSHTPDPIHPAADVRGLAAGLVPGQAVVSAPEDSQAPVLISTADVVGGGQDGPLAWAPASPDAATLAGGQVMRATAGRAVRATVRSPSAPARAPAQLAPKPGGASATAATKQVELSPASVDTNAWSRSSSVINVKAAKVRQGRSSSTFLTKNTVIAERYRVLGILGSGGMATVYRAHDQELEEDVALKLLKNDKSDAEAQHRFRQEMRICRRLQHPNIVRTYEFGVWEGRRFITMELMEGRDLAETLLMRKGPLPLSQATDLAVQALEGLGAAHLAGVIHRDVKPHNLFVLRGGKRLKVMDFGIAKTDDVSLTITNGEQVLGTPAYLAPERLKDHVELSIQTDLYSMGVCMYQVYTGQLPFTAPDISSLLTSIVLEEPKPPRERNPDVPPALQDVVLRLMHKRPEGRYRNCGDAIADLRRIQATLPLDQD